MDKNKVTDDVWNKIKQYEYKYALDVNSKLEMEDLIAREYKENITYYTDSFNKNETVEKDMYNYMFGIDSIEIKNISQQKDSCFVSELINP